MFSRFVWGSFHMAWDDSDKNCEEEDDWGRPPSPDTPENQAKAAKARRVLALVMGVGVTLPFVLYFLLHGPPSCGISV